MIDSNTFKNNYASYNGIIVISGATFPKFSNNVLTSNGDSYDEILANFGVLTKTASSYSLSQLLTITNDCTYTTKVNLII